MNYVVHAPLIAELLIVDRLSADVIMAITGRRRIQSGLHVHVRQSPLSPLFPFFSISFSSFYSSFSTRLPFLSFPFIHLELKILYSFHLIDLFLVFLNRSLETFPEPPSAPQNVSFNFVDPTSVIITWSAPKFSGGRNDTRYRVDCDICGPTVSYAPSQDYLNETKVVVSGLLPLSSYRFQVYAENGASGHDSSQFSDITVKTQSAGELMSKTLKINSIQWGEWHVMQVNE